LAADPFAFPPRGRHLVPGSLGDDLALELGKRQEDVQCQAADGRRRIELLGDRHEAHAILVEHFDNPSKVRQGSAEPVDLVDNDAVYCPRLYRGEEPLQCRAVHVGAGAGLCESHAAVNIRREFEKRKPGRPPR
jgi:hypothetical protein